MKLYIAALPAFVKYITVTAKEKALRTDLPLEKALTRCRAALYDMHIYFPGEQAEPQNRLPAMPAGRGRPVSLAFSCNNGGALSAGQMAGVFVTDL